MQNQLPRSLNKLYEPVAGILGGSFTAAEVTKSGFDWHMLLSPENLNYLIIGSIGAILFAVLAYLSRVAMDAIFKRKK
ncbi:hypothetical protein [uncultured Draconibacterium sp.]|uniref:hypothetical protein n=1 Tax=uncultured Draconibacterium sp. TaxID=1573823 RepID=UPI0029C95F7F|nr:hypothetical protein [uncultured Draconibacterium sp.]